MLNGLVPSAGRRPPGGSTCGLALAVWIATSPARTICSTIIRVAPAVVAVVHADDGDAAGLRLGDGDLRAAIRRDVADLVAAIDQGGHRRLAHDAHRCARLAGLLVLGDRQDARQAGEAIAAQRVVDQLVGDDRRLIGRIADAAQRRLAELACFGNTEAKHVRPVRIEHGSASLERAGRTLFGEGAGGLGEILGSDAASPGSPGAAPRATTAPAQCRRARIVERTPSGGFFATSAASSRAACIYVPLRRHAIDDAGRAAPPRR